MCCYLTDATAKAYENPIEIFSLEKKSLSKELAERNQLNVRVRTF